METRFTENDVRKILIVIFVILSLSSCKKDESISISEEEKVDLEISNYDIDTLNAPQSLSQRFSYAYGNLLAESLESAEQEVDPYYFARGFLDYYGTSYFTEDELDAIFVEYQNKMLEEAEAEFARESEENLKEAEDFLKANRMRAGVITTDSGLEYEIVRSSDTGASPKEDDAVLIDYTMTLLDSQVIESSYDRGLPSEINVSDLIEGAKEGIMLMKEGERFRFYIHPSLAYGENGVSKIGPNELLIFEVELHNVI